jgi:hypothetical protein
MPPREQQNGARHSTGVERVSPGPFTRRPRGSPCHGPNRFVYEIGLAWIIHECRDGGQAGPAGAWTGVLLPGRDIGVVMVSV